MNRKIQVANTYRCRMVAKQFPKLQKGVLDKITEKNGFTRKEVREYKRKLRDLALGSLKKPNAKRYFTDHKRLSVLMVWEDTAEGANYWWELAKKLYKLALIPTLTKKIEG